jgi:hypothetical protein
MVKLALPQGSDQISTHPNSSTGSAATGSCTAVLLWLVLLGRSCSGVAMLVQHWQSNPCPDGWTDSNQWSLQRYALVLNLPQLQASLAGVVQWLVVAHTVQQLSALGYQPEGMHQQLVEAADALRVGVLPLCIDMHTAFVLTREFTTAMKQGSS